jgi:iron(III) transport system substrate-binding protein
MLSRYASARLALLLLLPAILLLAACQAIVPATPSATTGPSDRLVVYSGRSENLVAPIIERFSAATGISVDVRYGGTSEMAITIIEEGRNSPADIFFAQDAGALGELAKAGRLAELPGSLLDQVPDPLHSQDRDWIGISGRARVLVYNTNMVSTDALPDDIWGLTTEEWRGRVGWAPSNGSFQAFVTALRILEGEERAREWLEAMLANDVQQYPNNSAIVAAVGSGEVAAGLANHYYLYRFLAEQGDTFPARNYFFPVANAGSMINVAGVGMLDTSTRTDAALRFIEFLISEEAQQFFATETLEYPLIDANIELPADLQPLSSIATPDLDLSDLDDLQGTLELLQDVGALE